MTTAVTTGARSLAELPDRVMPGLLAAVGDIVRPVVFNDGTSPFAIAVFGFPEDANNHCGPVVRRYGSKPACLPGDVGHHAEVLEPLQLATLVHQGDPTPGFSGEQLLEFVFAAAHSLVMRRGATSSMRDMHQTGLRVPGDPEGPATAMLFDVPLLTDRPRPSTGADSVKLLVATVAWTLPDAQLLCELTGVHLRDQLFRGGHFATAAAPTLGELTLQPA